MEEVELSSLDNSKACYLTSCRLGRPDPLSLPFIPGDGLKSGDNGLFCPDLHCLIYIGSQVTNLHRPLLFLLGKSVCGTTFGSVIYWQAYIVILS